MIPLRSLGIGLAGFVLGVLFMALLVESAGEMDDPVVIAGTPEPAETGLAESVTAAPAPRECRGADRAEAAAELRTPPSAADAVAYLRERRLHLPVAGVAIENLHSSFSAKRGGSRRHEAIDILAPRHTKIGRAHV